MGSASAAVKNEQTSMFWTGVSADGFDTSVGVSVALLFEDPVDVVGVDVEPTTILLSGDIIEQAWISRDMAMTTGVNRLRRVCFFIKPLKFWILF